MVDSPVAGALTYGLIISAGKVGDIPSGASVRLAGMNLKGLTKFLQKIKEIAGDTSYSTKDGKKSRSITLPRLYVKPEVENTATEEWGAAKLQFEQWHDAGDPVIYIWAFHFVDNMYIPIGYESGANVDWLTGHIIQFGWELEGTLYSFNNIQYQGCRS